MEEILTAILEDDAILFKELFKTKLEEKFKDKVKEIKEDIGKNFFKLTEAKNKYYIEVEVRDASKAEGIIRDILRKNEYEMIASNYYEFDSEEIAAMLVDEFKRNKIGIDSTNVEA